MRRSSARLPGLLTTLALVLRPCTADALQGGAEDHTTAFAVSIADGTPSAPTYRCSGTLISANVVLTARHCVDRLSTDGESTCAKRFEGRRVDATSLWVSIEPRVAPSAVWTRVRSITTPEAPEVCGSDIALLTLESRFADATAARPVVSQAESQAIAERGVFGLAPFGGSSPDAADSGTRRSRFDVPVRCAPGLARLPCSGSDGEVDAAELTGGAGPSPGDSGSGAIPADDRRAVFAVLSRGRDIGATCASGVFVRTDAWRWLIAKTVLEAAAPERAPAWTSDVFPARAAEGDACLDDSACPAETECRSLDRGRSLGCVRLCSAGCRANQQCAGDLCVARPPAAEGCSAGSSRDWPHETLLGVVVLGLFLLRARARGST